MSQPLSSRSGSFCSSEGIGSQAKETPTLPDSGGSLFSDELEPSPPRSPLFCVKCKKTLKTRRGFIQHKALHIQKECLKEGSQSMLRTNAEKETDSILDFLMQEPAAGPEGQARRAYICELQASVLNDKWKKFVTVVMDYLLEIVCRRSRVLPPKQHQRNLKALSQYLSSRAERYHLFNLLYEVVQAPEAVINPIVCGFSMKLFEILEIQFLSLMRSSRLVPCSNSNQDISLHKEEKQTLYYAAGYIVRRYIVMGRRQVNARSVARKKCAQEQFLFVQGEEYSDEFLEVKNWFDCLDRGGLIPVNEAFLNFTLDLEIIVRKSLTGSELKQEWVVNELFHVSNEHVLNYWYGVTANYFGENESLLFLDSVVERFVKFSGSAEAGLRRRQFEGTTAMRSVALRTDLKRN